MKQHKLFIILRSFSNNEISDFRKFLLSPFFNRNKNVLKLFDLIKKHYPDFGHNSLEKSILYENIFLKRSNSVRVIDNLFSELISNCNLFLSVKNIMQDEKLLEINLLEQYKSKDLLYLLNNRINKILNNPANSVISEGKCIFPNSYLYLLKIDYELISVQSKGKNKIQQLLSELYNSNSLIYYKNLLTLLSRYFMTKISELKFKPTDPFTNKLLSDLIYSSDEISHPAKNIILSLAHNLRSNRKIEYRRLINELESIKLLISADDYNLLLISLTIYFINDINEDDRNWCRERFNHTKKIVDSRAIIQTIGKFSDYFFIYIVNSALKAGDINWTENFINKHSNYIFEEKIFNTEKYCLALLLYEKSKLETVKKIEYCSIALEHLSNYKTKDFIRKIQINELKTKLFFESGQTELLLYDVDSSIHLLNNHKNLITKQLYEGNMNFLKYVKKLALFKYKLKNPNVNFLISKIMSSKNCINKKWLLAHILN